MKLATPTAAWIYARYVADDPYITVELANAAKNVHVASKAAKPIAAGIAVQARDSGRVLMLQRADSDDDPAAGYWEFPGGCTEPSDGGPFGTAVREWQEETGCHLPDGDTVGSYLSPNGRYQTFVYTVPSETDVPIFTDRDQVVNPDDPDGDATEALAWWEPDHLAGNPAVRPELLTSLDRLLDQLPSTDKTIDPDVLKVANHLHKAGNVRALESWYNSGAGGQINWGGPGDLTACHAIASRHMSSQQAWGFCQERARQAMGHFNKPDDGKS